MAGRTLTLFLILAYPLAVFFALTYWNLLGLAAVIVTIGLVRVALPDRTRPAFSRAGGALLISIGLLLLWMQADVIARAYPLLVNLAMASWFGASLARPPTVVEQFARLQDPELPAYAVAYTRKVTWVWVAFFLANGLVAGYTTFFASLATWTCYNGIIAYVLMGCVFGVEFLTRRVVRARQETDFG